MCDKMRYEIFIFIVILLGLFISVFAAPIEEENAALTLKSSEVIPIDLVNCTSNSEAIYQCVRIEDCKARRRRGSRRFCKWEGKPTHVCCLEKRFKKSSTRHKRHGWYSHRDFEPSRRFANRNNRWRPDEDEENCEEPWNHPSHHGDRFFHHRHHHFHDYNRDSISGDSEKKYNSLDDANAEPECGVLEEEELGRITTATDRDALPLETSSPWMVAIGKTRNNDESALWFCSGVLISKKIVLTAAHCIVQGTPDSVRVGTQNLNSTTDIAYRQDLKIESSVIHPNYKQPLVYHDIAIIRLRNPVSYSKYVRPICLPPNDGNLYENTRITFTGWDDNEYVGRQLRQAEMSVISNSDCNTRYGLPSITRKNNITLPKGIIGSQLCAWDEKGDEHVCYGDSGGPIVWKKEKRRVLIGILSAGLDCGTISHPDIYTRVSSYINWIEKFLQI